MAVVRYWNTSTSQWEAVSAGIQGPTGPASTVTGPTGAASTVTGPTGATGTTGATGSSATYSTVSTTPPSSPINGQAWLDSNTGAYYVYYGSAWIETAQSQALSGPTGSTGPTGAASTVTGPTGSVGSTGPTGAASTVTGPTGPAFTGGTLTSSLVLATGTISLAPARLVSGPVLTNATAGVIEYDGNEGYLTTNATHGRGGIATLTLASSTATKSLTSATTANQPLFATPTTGALTVAATTSYLVDALIFLNMGTTNTRTVSFSLAGAGTATFTSAAFETSYVTGASGTLATPQNTFWTSATGGIMNASSTTATAYFRVKGIIRVNASGTIIPAITFSAAPGGTNTVGTNSFFALTPIGSNTVTTIGAWA